MKILKGILMWITAFSCFLFIAAVDSLSLTALFGWLLVNIALVYASIKLISEEEAEVLSGMRFLNSLLD